MQLSPRPSPKAISTAVAERDDPVLPAILEFQSPSTAIINTPVPRSARGISWMIGSMVLAGIVATAVIRVDRVVEAPGKVVSQSPTIVVQPLDTAIVRSIDVHEGETVKAGQVLARLDPTFAAADMGALAAQVAALQAQVSRLQAEVNNQSFSYSGTDPNLALQAAIYAQRKSEYNYKLENYRQKADSLVATIRRANSDMAGYKDRLQYAQSLEQMRKELEKLQVGSRLNTLAAMDSRAEMQRNLEGAEQQAQGAQRDLAALIAEREGYIQNWHADAAQQLADATSKLSDARENLNKAQLRRQLVELRADRDATVLTISKVSVGSVLQSGQQFITLVPLDAPLEIETNITGRDSGYVHVGDPVAIKFDTFPYTLYGLGRGVVRIVSADSFTAQDDQRNPTGALPMPQSANAEPYYRARVTIDKLELHGVPEGFKVVPGMPVTADIKVGERTLFEYFFSRVLPVGDEAMREP
ncbi:MAG: secretion protein [Rhodospirillales bacterium 69-11]|nr:HlyD family type I secretion periplasmic adaptor subunit [Rhodospirillales bacterium]OJW25653.1 MAG: secretion protein [Rhodospirillales bacterium 69-11]